MNAAVIIPALNEERCIRQVVEEVRCHFQGPIIVADNGSSDDTASEAIAAGALVAQAPVPGYGRACNAGAELAGDAEFLIFMDGDGSDCPEDIPAMLEAAQTAPLVLAVRRGPRVQPGSIAPAARFGNWLSGRLIGLFTGVRPGDLSPLKGIRSEAFRAIAPVEQTYGWTVEIIATAAVRGLAIAEVETGYRHRAGGASKVSGTLSGSARAAWRILAVLARVGWRRMSSPWRGAAAGVFLGLGILAVFSAWLLTNAPAGYDVLVATWLVAWPTLLAACCLGAFAGKILSRGSLQ